MSPFHPTKRDLIVVLLATSLLGLFLQFGIADSSGTRSLLGLKVGSGNHADEEDWDFRSSSGAGGRKGSWLDNVETGARYAQTETLAGMAETRMKWGEDGPARTEVLAHAPGTLHFSPLLSFHPVRVLCRKSEE